MQTEWPERYDAAGAAVRSLQQRLEETKHSSREKDGIVTKLKNRLRQLEDAVQNACKEVDETEARLMKEHKMLEDVSRPLRHLRICCYALLLNCRCDDDVCFFVCLATTRVRCLQKRSRRNKGDIKTQIYESVVLSKYM